MNTPLPPSKPSPKTSSNSGPEFLSLWAYVDNKKRKIGYAYLTKNGSLCIKGDKMLDKAQLGRLLISGAYVFPPEG